MGFIICERHGGNGIVLSCPHLSESISKYKFLNNFVKRVDLDKDDADGFEIEFIYYLCECCDKENEKTNIEEFPEYFIQPSCAKCFEELSNLAN